MAAVIGQVLPEHPKLVVLNSNIGGRSSEYVSWRTVAENMLECLFESRRPEHGFRLLVNYQTKLVN